jgi:flagellar biogenesis protein FliO
LKRFTAIALTLAATALTPGARADEPPVPVPSSTPEPATPLALRSNKLELVREPEHASTGWKLVAGLVVIGAAVVYFRKRRGAKGTKDTQLTIVRRTTVGLRSELLVVNVEGQRFLLGVTPHSIQSIAILDGEAPALVGDTLADRFAGMLDTAERRAHARPSPERSIPALPEADDEAEQALGLRAIGRGR